MNFYVCVYRQGILGKSEENRARRNACDDPELQEYLQRYKDRFKKRKQGIGCFYDWGDDPAFFAAEEFLGDVRKASWGVCRPNVRNNLEEGDIVVFFCAQQQKDKTKWNYYYVGLGTVGEAVQERRQVGKKPYLDYKNFYNLLIDSKGGHREMISYHSDWKERSEFPYIIFDSDETHFNIVNPLHVATYNEGTGAWKGKILECWRSSDERVQKIYELVGKRDGGAKLRTTNKYHPHKEMNLATFKRVKLDDKQLEKKRREFLEISREVASR